MHFISTSLANGGDVDLVFGRDNGNNLSGRLRYYYNTTQASRYIMLHHFGDSQGLTIKDGGNVGIGTASPNAPLSVVSASNANAIRMYGRSADNYSELYVSSNDGATNYAFLQGHSAQVKLWTLQSIPLIFGTNSTERMRIASDGDVGIGMSPDAGIRLQVRDSANAAIMELSGTAGRGLRLFTRKSNYSTDSGQNDAAVVYNAQDTEASSVYGQHIFQTGGTTRMQIDSVGVGIGTATPAKPLHVRTTADGTLVRVDRGNVSSWDFSIGNTPHISGGSSGDLEIIPQNGNMGFAVARAGQTGVNMRIRDGHLTLGSGIKFNSDTADANMLDDYEEGTCTMGIGTSGSAPSVSLGTSTAYYTKTGNVCTVSWYTGASTVSGAGTGIMKITGFPFAAKANYQGGIIWHANKGSNSFFSNSAGCPAFYIETNNTYAYPIIDGTTGGSGIDTTGTKYMMITATYLTT
jgi:hypothetical protein